MYEMPSIVASELPIMIARLIPFIEHMLVKGPSRASDEIRAIELIASWGTPLRMIISMSFVKYRRAMQPVDMRTKQGKGLKDE